MLPVKEAQKILLDHILPIENEILTLESASGRVLAEDIISPVSHPLFDQSAVDGYAFKYDGIRGNAVNMKTLKIIGEIKAGDDSHFTLRDNETIRIFTGAKVPSGCNTVIMQEDVEKVDGFIKIKKFPETGANVRPKGKQIVSGEFALSRGTKLNPASIGFLASLGIKSVIVSQLPRIVIIVTGNEFSKESRYLSEGQIYESNGSMLKSAFAKLNIAALYTTCEDNIEKLYAITHDEILSNDIIIITGGVSVGDYDYTRAVLEKLGFDIIFHKVLQKPGMPILFAKKGGKAVFGLPGNPRSALVCYYEYALPFIEASMGNNSPYLTEVYLSLACDYDKKEEKSFFLNSKMGEDGILILDGQDSHMLRSFANSDSLVYLPEGKKRYYKGESVEVHILPI